MMLLLEAGRCSRRRSSDQPDQGDGKYFGPCCRQIHAPWHGIGDPTSRGWPKLRRPRQRGPDSIIDQHVSDLCGEIKLRNRRSTAALETKILASFRLIK